MSRQKTSAKLILIAGLPGSGKSTVARTFAQKYGATHFNSDQVRRELGLWGSYRPSDKLAVYEALLDRAEEALAVGKTVVVDSTFFKAALRRPFVELAENQGVVVKWVLVTASVEKLRLRVSVPRPDSEADLAVLEKIQADFEPLQPPFLTIDSTDTSPEALADAIHRYLTHG